MHGVKQTIFPLILKTKQNNVMLFMLKCVPRTIKGVFIAGNRIMEVTETKFLGVIIDYKLNWSPHIMYIRKKLMMVSHYPESEEKIWPRDLIDIVIYICLSIFELLYTCMG